jgi:phosphohistidine phosphatase
MKTLFIIRHAKSSWKKPKLSDHQRPLNKRGKRNVVDMGGRLKDRAIRPDLIISSDARRAMDTAMAIIAKLGISPVILREEPALYLASAMQILDIAQNLDDRWQQVMIFGHNPGLTEFVNFFYPQPIANLPTAGVVELRFNVKTWRDIDRQNVMFSDFDFPKKTSNT